DGALAGANAVDQCGNVGSCGLAAQRHSGIISALLKGWRRMNIAFTRAADGLARRAFSAEDVRRMVDAGILNEDDRIELIEGDLVVMSAKGYAHDYVKSMLNVAIVRALPDHLMIGMEMTVQFADRTILEPDIAVFARSSWLKSGANFSQIAPGGLLLATEVAASSLSYDKGLKARLYAR